MKIKIKTTEKKLTKSLISQMKIASGDAFEFGKPIGYIINAIKTARQIVLISYNDEYYILPITYSKESSCVFRYIGKWRRNKNFNSNEEQNAWWQRYREIIKEAETHIYI